MANHPFPAHVIPFHPITNQLFRCRSILYHPIPPCVVPFHFITSLLTTTIPSYVISFHLLSTHPFESHQNCNSCDPNPCAVIALRLSSSNFMAFGHIPNIRNSYRSIRSHRSPPDLTQSAVFSVYLGSSPLLRSHLDPLDVTYSNPSDPISSHLIPPPHAFRSDCIPNSFHLTPIHHPIRHSSKISYFITSIPFHLTTS